MSGGIFLDRELSSQSENLCEIQRELEKNIKIEKNPKLFSWAGLTQDETLKTISVEVSTSNSLKYSFDVSRRGVENRRYVERGKHTTHSTLLFTTQFSVLDWISNEYIL